MYSSLCVDRNPLGGFAAKENSKNGEKFPVLFSSLFKKRTLLPTPVNNPAPLFAKKPLLPTPVNNSALFTNTNTSPCINITRTSPSCITLPLRTGFYSENFSKLPVNNTVPTFFHERRPVSGMVAGLNANENKNGRFYQNSFPSDEWSTIRNHRNPFYLKVNNGSERTTKFSTTVSNSVKEPLCKNIYLNEKQNTKRVLSKSKKPQKKPAKHVSPNQIKTTAIKNSNPNGSVPNLSEFHFKIAKTMTCVLKTTHHLHQVETQVPKQIAKQAELLTKFPKPFAPNEGIKIKFDEIAKNWCTCVCETLQFHYNTTRNEGLGFLESVENVVSKDWDACLSLALKWTRSSKQISDFSLKEGLELINLARDKFLRSLETSLEVSNANLVSFCSNSPARTHETSISENQTVLEQADSQMEALSNHINNIQPVSSHNYISFASVSKKNWVIPVILEHKKLLISDENFVGPVPSDFLHISLPNCSIWDLNNVLKRSSLDPNLSLIIFHIGYKSFSTNNNLNYIRTSLDKVKSTCPNTKVFFTSLVSKSFDSTLGRFNKFCQDNLADNFLDCDLKNISYNTDFEKSEKLFQEWFAKLNSLN